MSKQLTLSAAISVLATAVLVATIGISDLQGGKSVAASNAAPVTASVLVD